MKSSCELVFASGNRFDESLEENVGSLFDNLRSVNVNDVLNIPMIPPSQITYECVDLPVEIQEMPVDIQNLHVQEEMEVGEDSNEPSTSTNVRSSLRLLKQIPNKPAIPLPVSNKETKFISKNDLSSSSLPIFLESKL